MKKKLIVSLLSCVMISTLLTGCTNPISGLTDKFSKDDTEDVDATMDDTEQTSGGEYNSYVYIIGAGTYSVGDEVTVEDVVEVDEMISGSLLQSYFLDESYIASPYLSTSTAGEYIVTVVGEFSDGGTYQIEYSYIVEEDTGMSEIQALVDNASYYEVVDTTDVLGTKITVLDNLYETEYEGVTTEIALEVYDTTVSEVVSSMSLSYLIDEVESSEEEDSVDTEFYTALLTTESSHITEPSIDSSNVIALRSVNDVALHAYPLTAEIDNHSYVLGYIVSSLSSLNEDTKCVFVISDTGSYMLSMTAVAPLFNMLSDAMSAEFEEDDTIDYTTYAESIVEEAFSTIEFPADNPIDVYNILIGGEVLKSSTNEVSIDGSNESASADGDIEEPEITSVTSTYQSKYPELYEWPENDTKYRKWIYIIDDQVTYTGSIINPDGTVVSTTDGDTVSSTLADTASSSNSSTSTSSTSSTTSTAASPTLISSYGSYVIKNADGIFDFDTVNSTSSCVYLSIDGIKYYVETARASKVATYTSSCLYSTTGMAEGDYEIEAGSVVDAGDFTYTPYTITYTSTEDSKSVTTDYIFVVNYDSDYLVIYGDNLSDIDYTDMMEIVGNIMKV